MQESEFTQASHDACTAQAPTAHFQISVVAPFPLFQFMKWVQLLVWMCGGGWNLEVWWGAVGECWMLKGTHVHVCDYILYMVWVLYISQLGFSPNKVPLTAIACDSSSACHPSCALAFFHLFSSLYVGWPSLFGCVCIYPGSSEFCPGWRGGHMCCLGT